MATMARMCLLTIRQPIAPPDADHGRLRVLDVGIRKTLRVNVNGIRVGLLVDVGAATILDHSQMVVLDDAVRKNLHVNVAGVNRSLVVKAN